MAWKKSAIQTALQSKWSKKRSHHWMNFSQHYAESMLEIRTCGPHELWLMAICTLVDMCLQQFACGNVACGLPGCLSAKVRATMKEYDDPLDRAAPPSPTGHLPYDFIGEPLVQGKGSDGRGRLPGRIKRVRAFEFLPTSEQPVQCISDTHSLICLTHPCGFGMHV